MNGEMRSKVYFKIEFLWIPEEFGGHNGKPFEGMRAGIRWHKYIREYLECPRDVQCEKIEYDSESSIGSALCSIYMGEQFDSEPLNAGHFIELINGYKVLAVGKIVA